MTTQVLIPSRLSSSESLPMSDSRPSLEAAQTSESTAVQSISARKLPYQSEIQVELLHLQADTEALLLQLQTLKQQRMAEELDQQECSVPAPLVASR